MIWLRFSSVVGWWNQFRISSIAILDTAKFEEDLVPRVLLFIRVCLGNLDSAAQHGGDNRSTLAHALQSSVSTLLDTFDNEMYVLHRVFSHRLE